MFHAKFNNGSVSSNFNTVDELLETIEGTDFTVYFAWTVRMEETINNLVKMMMDENSRVPYNHNMYMAFKNAVDAILKNVLGERTFTEIDGTHENWNWYGNSSFVEDVEAAVQEYVSNFLSEINKVCKYFITDSHGDFYNGVNGIFRPVWSEHTCKMLSKKDLEEVYEILGDTQYLIHEVKLPNVY